MLPMNTSLDFQAQMMLVLNDTFSKLSTVIADNKITDSHTNDVVHTTSNTTLMANCMLNFLSAWKDKPYSILTFGYHENTKILPYFHNNLLYYRRYIDEIFGVWTYTNHPQTMHNWSNFKDLLNQYSQLRWNVENLTTTTTFLDLKMQSNKINSSQADGIASYELSLLLQGYPD
jgi:hypothetical protein